MKVAIAGYGAEGQSSYQYYLGKGDDVTIVAPTFSADFMPPKDANVLTGEDVYQKLQGFDIVMRTPPLRPSSIGTNGKIWSQTNEFFAHCPAPIIGVTGTKGKGTTASLIASILRSSGMKVHLLGNIGVAPLSVLSEISSSDIVVFELSSFQLWDAEKSPELAVVVMVEPDHLDIHDSLEEYVDAKGRIALFQNESDKVIYHPTNMLSRQVAEQGKGKKTRYAIKDDDEVYIEDGFFMKSNNAICSVDALKIPGRHNQENACAAISAALAFGARVDSVEAGLADFHGLPHRLRYVRTFGDADYYDDSIATTVGSALAALDSFEGKKIIVLGGSDKGVAYDELIDACHDKNVHVVSIGETGHHIAKLCKQKHVSCDRVEGLMASVVQHIAAIAQKGDTVILSPASASFDQYKSYSDRGEKFVAAVEALK
ncbi:UDP-N-acetylmuramoyl-L-alanine--D-glutamate ligase [Microbacteriaceae bacterium]|nr:UDP-N-acetylmuramoyl-L-alanine--D-glutamate ligase [Candidatus Saccharibacteria bacterium]